MAGSAAEALIGLSSHMEIQRHAFVQPQFLPRRAA